MVTSDEYRHVPTGTLAVLAQRLGKVFASPSTWYRLVRVHRWRRPRRRIHPSRPKVGIRASRPNEYWHIDTTVIRLLDGTRAYLQEVIDNFSRKILGWRVSERFDPRNTPAVLLEASRHLRKSGAPRTLLADGGVENFNAGVDEFIESGALRRLLAMTGISFSNSLIESWWRVMKHQWLYLSRLSGSSSDSMLANTTTDSRTRRSAGRHPRHDREIRACPTIQPCRSTKDKVDEPGQPVITLGSSVQRWVAPAFLRERKRRVRAHASCQPTVAPPRFSFRCSTDAAS